MFDNSNLEKYKNNIFCLSALPAPALLLLLLNEPTVLSLSPVQVTQVVTRNLNRVIDANFYPVEEAKRSNVRHRPVGLGVQGLADAFIMVGVLPPSCRPLYASRYYLESNQW